MRNWSKFLLYVETPECSQSLRDWTLELTRQLAARLIAVHIIDPGVRDGDEPRTEEELSAQEEAAWKTLYEIEDQAFEQDVRVSLLLEQGEPLDRLADLCRSYEVDLLVVPADSRLPPAGVIGRIPSPVVFVGNSRR